jgi:hypothetical protein
LSIYTPAPPDQYAVLEGVEHFRKSKPERVPVYSDVHAWSRNWNEAQDCDPRFLEADVTTLAEAVLLALEHSHQRVLAKDRRKARLRIKSQALAARSMHGSN